VHGAVLDLLERRRQVKDRAAALDRHHAPGREALAVADAVHLVEDRDLRVARAQEVRVQRVYDVVLDGAAGRDQRLPRDLAAEHALAVLLRAAPAEDVHLQLLEVEEVDQAVEDFLHRGQCPTKRVRRKAARGKPGPAASVAPPGGLRPTRPALPAGATNDGGLP
jgi:hypothetical protein